MCVFTYIIINLFQISNAIPHCILCKKSKGLNNFCDTCNIYFYESYFEHNSSEAHEEYKAFKEWLNKANEYSEDEEDSSDSKSITTDQFNDYRKQFTQINNSRYLLCRVCKVKVVEINIIDHVFGKKHLKILKDICLLNGIVETTEIVYYCNICHIYTVNLLDHKENNIYHQYWMMRQYEKHNLKYYVYDFNGENRKALFYRNMYEAMLDVNFIKIQPNGNFFCRPCKMRLMKVSEVFHMFQQRHKKALRNFYYGYLV